MVQEIVGSDEQESGQDEQLLQAAHLYYVDNLTQAEIARVLGVSRPTVSRLLTRARDEGIVQVTIRPWKVRDEALEQQFVQLFGLKGAIIVRGVGVYSSAAARKLIGYCAAPYVAELIPQNEIVGIGQGRTLAELAAAIRPSSALPPQALRIVQLLGDVAPHHSETLSHELTRLLASRLDGQAYYLSAPAIVESKTLRDILINSDTIRPVCAMYQRVQLALVGIGAVEDSPLVLGGLVSPEQASQMHREGIVGDICGHFYDQDGMLRATVFSNRTVGIGWDELRQCPTVVCVAGGPEKVLPILGVLRGKVVNYLITDRLTALEVIKRQTDG